MRKQKWATAFHHFCGADSAIETEILTFQLIDEVFFKKNSNKSPKKLLYFWFIGPESPYAYYL